MYRGQNTHRQLAALVDIISQSGNPDEPFYYLGGPMTGIPQFNFPRFNEVAAKLREQGYNIVSPAELDDPEVQEAVMKSEDGAPGTGGAGKDSHADFLARDIIIVTLPNCVGGIFIEGWENSRGAAAETWVLSYLKRDLFEYGETEDGELVLSWFDRDTRLCELGIGTDSGTVPQDRPGERTVQATREPTRSPYFQGRGHHESDAEFYGRL